MFRYKTLFLAISAAALSTGCTSWPSTQSEAFDIKPVQTVTHGNGSAQALYEMGRYYQGQLRYDQAQSFYQQALAIEPQNVDALTGMGVVQAMQGQYAQALEAFKAAVALEPDSPYLLNNLGYIHWLLKDRERALDAYRQALRLEPLNARFRTNLRAVMLDAANKPAVVTEDKPDAAKGRVETQPASVVLARSALGLDQVAPQVYELRMAETITQSAQPPTKSSVQTAMRTQTAPARLVKVASGATIGKTQPAQLSLNEVVPRVYVLQLAERKQALPESAVLAALAPTLDNKKPVAFEHNAVPNAAVLGKPGVVAGVSLDPVASPPHEKQAPTQKLLEVSRVADQKAEALSTAPATPVSGTPSVHSIASVNSPVPMSSNKGVNLEVLNANGVRGIAGRVSSYLAGRGFPSVGVGDARHQASTRIEYLPGYGKQAHQLSALLPTQVALVEADGLGQDARLRLIVGKDLRQGPQVWNMLANALSSAQPIAAKPDDPRTQGGLQLSVANGNGIKGLAQKMAVFLAPRGYPTVAVYDLKPFNKSITRIEYRQGYAAQALELGGQLPLKVAYLESNRFHGNVRLVLGRDMIRKSVVWSPWSGPLKVAESQSQSRL